MPSKSAREGLALEAARVHRLEQARYFVAKGEKVLARATGVDYHALNQFEGGFSPQPRWRGHHSYTRRKR